ncbi:hypothetical protein RMATCC62417_10277 [Rhizopus microsporus]|nr:hypothetical protein RMATCC62417_10277 [Rhizopus microsporus]
MVSRMMVPVDLVTPAPRIPEKSPLDTHLEGHRGAQTIINALHNDGVHWTKLKDDALGTVRKCPDCQKFNIAKHGYNPLTSIYADAPWEHISIDTAGPFPTSLQGNQYIPIIVDVFIRFCVIKALPDKSSLAIALALRSILSLFGRPKIIQSNTGTEYVNEIVKLLQGKEEDWGLYVDNTQKALNNTHTALHSTRLFSLMHARRPNENKDYSNVLDKAHSPETRNQLVTRINEINDTVLPAIRERNKASQAAAQDKFNLSHRILTDIPAGS